MTKTMETILGDIYDAWRAQDLEWLASYLPDDFYHVMHIPAGGLSDRRALRGQACRCWSDGARWCRQFDILRFDTSNLLINKNCAAAEITLQYRLKPSGEILDTTKANFWAFEAGWPVKLTEYYDVAALEAVTARLNARPSA